MSVEQLELEVAELKKQVRKLSKDKERLNELFAEEKKDSWQFYQDMRHWKNKASVLEAQQNRARGVEYRNQWLPKAEEATEEEYEKLKR